MSSQTHVNIGSSSHFDPAIYTGGSTWGNLPHPSAEELRTLITSLMWTTGLQTDIDDFLAKYPHLAPPKEP